jgi:hypothetical protein
VNKPRSFEMVVLQMALDRRLCPDTIWAIRKSSVKPLCQRIRTMATDVSRSDGHRTEVDRMENEEEVTDFGSEHETVSSECDTEAGN